MANNLLIDTDILVDFFRGKIKAVSFIQKHADRILLASVVVAELYAGVKGKEEKQTLDQFISLFPVLALDKDIAIAGGLYKQTYGKSHGTGLVDAILAATAEHHQANLVTLNTKHYPMLKGLKPAYVKRQRT
ncbi:PIN domain-containing protein [candidate division KSB1 bacterium]|nr:PIN domain-containing protein [candidate division KSB1 bacterium]